MVWSPAIARIGVMFGNPETTPGGKALKFYASVRVDIRRIGAIKQTDGVVTGNRTRVKVVKNKVAPPFTEAEFDIMYNEGISSIVLDSVAALVTKQELEGEIGDSTVGAQARLMSAALRKLTSLISKARTCCIFTNQIREKIGVMFGNPETTPGGKALKFYASVRVDIRRIGAIKQTDGVVTGNRTNRRDVRQS